MATTVDIDQTTDDRVTDPRAGRLGELLLMAFLAIGLLACPAIAVAGIVR